MSLGVSTAVSVMQPGVHQCKAVCFVTL